MAIASGVSTGHLVLAELAEATDGNARDQAAVAATHRRQVAPQDQIRYFGHRPSGRSVLKTVLDVQVEKTKSLTATAKDAIDRQLKPTHPQSERNGNVRRL